MGLTTRGTADSRGERAGERERERERERGERDRELMDVWMDI